MRIAIVSMLSLLSCENANNTHTNPVVSTPDNSTTIPSPTEKVDSPREQRNAGTGERISEEVFNGSGPLGTGSAEKSVVVFTNVPQEADLDQRSPGGRFQVEDINLTDGYFEIQGANLNLLDFVRLKSPEGTVELAIKEQNETKISLAAIGERLILTAGTVLDLILGSEVYAADGSSGTASEESNGSATQLFKIEIGTQLKLEAPPKEGDLLRYSEETRSWHPASSVFTEEGDIFPSSIARKSEVETSLAEKAPIDHSHDTEDLNFGTIKESAVDAKLTRDSELTSSMATKAGISHSHEQEDISGTIADTNIDEAMTRDSELNAGLALKAEISHSHEQEDLTGTIAETIIDEAITRDSELNIGLALKAEIGHSHEQEDITGTIAETDIDEAIARDSELNTALTAKAESDHTHSYVDNTGLNDDEENLAPSEKVVFDQMALKMNSAYFIDSDTTINIPIDYADLTEAMDYLRTKRIVNNAQITIQIADGTHNYSSAVSLNHSDGNHISIVGNSGDETAVVLSFSGSAGLLITDGHYIKLINGMTIDGDDVTIADGVVISNFSQATLGPELTVSEFASQAIHILNGSRAFLHGVIVEDSHDGLLINTRSLVLADDFVARNNTNQGIYVSNSQLQGDDIQAIDTTDFDGLRVVNSLAQVLNITVTGNGRFGIYARNHAKVYADNCIVNTNTSHAFRVLTGSIVDCGGGNITGDILVNDLSRVYIDTATYSGTLSPAANSYDQNESYILQ